MKAINEEDKVGLYITVIVHLAGLVILLLFQIGAALKGNSSFVIDFSREEAIEKKIEIERIQNEQEAFDEEIGRRIDNLIAGRSEIDFKNTVVNRGALKDDRGTNAEELYKDAEKLSNDLKKGVKLEEDEDAAISVGSNEQKKEEKKAQYSGPSVVSYSLGGRKASSLPIPAYKCFGGGMVTVIITVNNQGIVIKAKVMEEVSTTDNCLRAYAVNAALKSRFSADPKAPANQAGDIVYQFIAQ